MEHKIPASRYSEDQQERIRACSTPEEYLALAESEGVELTDEQLDAVAGGAGLWARDDQPKWFAYCICGQRLEAEEVPCDVVCPKCNCKVHITA